MGSFCARGATARDAVRAGGANAAVVLHTANTASTARAICVLSLTDLDSPVPRQEQAQYLRSRHNSSRELHVLIAEQQLLPQRFKKGLKVGRRAEN